MSWPEEEIEATDIKTRKLLTKHGGLHLKLSFLSMYTKRTERGQSGPDWHRIYVCMYVCMYLYMRACVCVYLILHDQCSPLFSKFACSAQLIVKQHLTMKNIMPKALPDT